MLKSIRLAAAASVIAAIAQGVPAFAQNEPALRAYFEGQRVTLKLDMPGTSDGVDVRVDSARAIDFREHGRRLKEHGTAIAAGDSATITLIKMKKDLIEVQLGGGGFGTFGDDTSTSVNIKDVEKSRRERDLEKEIKDESDSRRKRELERERDTLRDRRERENRRIEAERVRAEELKRERIAYQRLKGGSRFNLKYSGNVPPGIRPEEVMAALAEYVDFGRSTSTPAPEVEPASPRVAADTPLRKGMLRSDVERALGRPQEVTDRREGSLLVTDVIFISGDQRITAQFVEDILIRYTITSK